MSIGANQFFSKSAVVWLRSETTEFRGRVRIDYKAKVYLQDNVSVEKGRGAQTVDLSQTVVEKGQAMVVQFGVSGEVFVTADKREIADPRGLELYKKAQALVVPITPEFVVRAEALVPEWPVEKRRPEKPVKEVVVKKVVPEKEKVVITKPGLIERIFAPKKRVRPAEVVARPKEKEPRFRYPVNISPAGEVPLEMERTEELDGTYIATVTQRFYLWQKQDEIGGLLELQADNAVIFYSGQEPQRDEEQSETGDVLAKGAVEAIYVSGDVVMTEGQRTIRTDEMYYDFQRKKALAINAVMRTFDLERGIPIYVRAVKLRRLAKDKFSAENIVLTALEEGAGSCMIGSLDRDAFRRVLEVPDHCEISLAVALGYPTEEPVMEEMTTESIKYYLDDEGVLHVPKRAAFAITHWDTY